MVALASSIQICNRTLMKSDSPQDPLKNANALPRCSHCGLHVPLCICKMITSHETRTKITIIMHAKETRRSTNSGHLVPLAINDCRVKIRGLQNHTMDTSDLIRSHFRNVVLFPSENAQILTRDWANAMEEPIHLIVPDGNWRQAKRMIYREPKLANLTRVTLPQGPPSRYRLRHHHNPGHISTFEAIIRTLAVLERPSLKLILERYFDYFVERSLWARGDLPAEAVTGGIPAAAFKPVSIGSPTLDELQ
jgi:DTW domain-containing protein YfiP